MTPKPPPHDELIEQAILGIYLRYPETQKRLDSVLKPEKFYISKHALIYKYIYTYKYNKNDSDVDIYSFISFLEKQNGGLADVGGRDYLFSLVEDMSTKGGLDSILNSLEEFYIRRDVIGRCHAIINSCYGKYDTEIGDIISDMQIVLEYGKDQNRNLASEVRELIDNSTGTITSTYVYNCLQLSTRKDKKNVSTILSRMEKEGLIKKTGRLGGEYRIVSNVYELKDWKNATASEIDVILPLGLSECVRVRPGSVICFAAKPNVGKTATAMDFIKLNCNKFDIKYFSSETDASEFNERAQARDSLDRWSLEFIDDWISNDIQDIIDPRAVNVIDYLEPPGGDFTQMAIKLTDINHSLDTGIAVVFIQVRGDSHGVGGEGMKEKPQLYCLMRVKSFPVLEMEIIKCKAYKYGYRNPYGLKCEFKINPKNGCELIPYGKFYFDKWRE